LLGNRSMHAATSRARRRQASSARFGVAPQQALQSLQSFERLQPGQQGCIPRRDDSTDCIVHPHLRLLKAPQLVPLVFDFVGVRAQSDRAAVHLQRVWQGQAGGQNSGQGISSRAGQEGRGSVRTAATVAARVRLRRAGRAVRATCLVSISSHHTETAPYIPCSTAQAKICNKSRAKSHLQPQLEAQHARRVLRAHKPNVGLPRRALSTAEQVDCLNGFRAIAARGG